MTRTNRQERKGGREKPKAHFILLPFAAQGHLIPMIDCAHVLAGHGVRISLITTHANAARIKPIIKRVKESNLTIQFIELAFPSAKFGLPEGWESIEHFVLRPELSRSFVDAFHSLNNPLEFFIQNLDSQPDCIITDACNGWTGPVARKFGIPSIIFQTPSCFFTAAAHSMEIHRVYDGINDEFESVIVPDFPVKLEVNKAKKPGFLVNPEYKDIYKMMVEEESMAEAVVVNTFDELERPFIELYEKVIGKRVWAIGPLCLYNESVDMKSCRGNKESADHVELQKWLDGRDAGTVLYANLGSVAYNSALQLMEIGRGLEVSNKPFIWVIKKIEVTDEVKQWLQGGFEERTKNRGLILIGWAPQMVILSHLAVGGFITHCGWNSILEAISTGVPMITWPHFADQFFNENFVVDVLKIGTSLGGKTPNFASPDVMVQKEDVVTAVLTIMGEGEDGKNIKTRAKDFAEKAKKTMEEGGSSYRNIMDMIRYIAGRRSTAIKENGH